MGNSINLENAFVEHLAERINAARKLYGSDSAYVIGLITAIEWIVEEADGGDAVRQALHRRIDSVIAPTTGGPVPSRPEREHREVEGAHHARIRSPRPSVLPGYVLLEQRGEPYGPVGAEGSSGTKLHFHALATLVLPRFAAVIPDGVDEPAVKRTRSRHRRAEFQTRRLAPLLGFPAARVSTAVSRPEHRLGRGGARPPHRRRGEHRLEVSRAR